MKDPIERQEAIDACIRVRELRAYDEIEEIKALPPAQPEIIHCKDCVHYYGEPGNPNIICFQMHEDDFCSYGERRENDKISN